MSANETVHTSATGGQKAGNDERYDLIPTEALRRLAIQAGEVTFGPHGGSFHQMMNHAWRFWAGEEWDHAYQWPHLMAAAFEAFRIVDPWRPPTWVLDDRRPGEARYDRIPPDALRQLALHFGVGARKYADDNWTRGYDWRLTFAAACRHAEQFRAGETHDPETGSHHLIAFAWHMLVLDEFTRINRGGDTRYATKMQQWLVAETAHLADTYRDDRRELAFTISPAPAGPTLRTADGRPYVNDLTNADTNTEWAGPFGRYRWDNEHARWLRQPTADVDWHPTLCTTAGYGPYTEHTTTGDDE